MDLTELGWQQYQRKQTAWRKSGNVGRVGVENKTDFVVHTEHGDLRGIIQGKFRHKAKSGADFPKVGDWVLHRKLASENKTIIEQVLPRYSLIARKSAGESTAPQIIAANVDVLFIIFALDQAFNPPLLERYLSMAFEGHVRPIVILNKIDKIKSALQVKKQGATIAPQVDSFALSAKSETGLHQIQHLIEPGRTIAFVGPSGAGKSTLINALLGSKVQSTAQVRLSDSKGRHTTTRRELFVLAGGGILIDTPGIRELETLSSEQTQKTFFSDVEQIAVHCRFRNCDHLYSKGCAVVQSLKDGKITQQSYDSFIKFLARIQPANQGYKVRRQKTHQNRMRKSLRQSRSSGRKPEK